MPNETGKVIEISVDETNVLRAKLGLPPLRGSNVSNPTASKTTSHDPASSNPSRSSNTSGDKVLELSVEDSNDLRVQLGLPPLRASSSSSSSKPVVHAPSYQVDKAKATAERIERAKLQRQVQEGMAKFGQNAFDEAGTTQSWAAKMRSSKAEGSQKQLSSTQQPQASQNYDANDLKGLQVAHAMSDLAADSTTVLTLADAPLLQHDEHRKVVGLGNHDDQQQLENVALAEQHKVDAGLKKKRQLELGMGRAGGYAGFDDDEFEEMGGSQGVSHQSHRHGSDGRPSRQRKGFEIGAHWNADDEDESDLFASERGKAISLEAKQADVTASDFMTAEEAEAERKERKMKFKKKDKKKQKKKSKRKQREDDEDDAEGDGRKKIGEAPKESGGAELLDELEATAVNQPMRKRKRRKNSDDNDDDKNNDGDNKPMERDKTTIDSNDQVDSSISKRTNYELAMARGKQRTNQAFTVAKKSIVQDEDAEPDDAFLDAALDKARRLNRLKAMSTKHRSGAESVMEAVQKSLAANNNMPWSGGKSIEFSVDETREFTRALQTKKDQSGREKKKVKSVTKEVVAETVDAEDEAMEDLETLAKSVKEDDAADVALEGATGTTAPIGRGVGGFLQLLQQTGESRLKSGGREEMRGRAKDKKTYEDYESLDLDKVVKIDMSSATDKDKEFANREVKLEYRDSHGRLLTRKEAYRELCYQFHGHGSGKRKEEKKLQQIAREQAEARAARQEGTLGALRATQKATGKAFVVHKTQS